MFVTWFNIYFLPNRIPFQQQTISTMIKKSQQNLLFLGLCLSILLLSISCKARYPIIKKTYAKTFETNKKVEIAIPEIYEMMLVATDCAFSGCCWLAAMALKTRLADGRESSEIWLQATKD